MPVLVTGASGFVGSHVTLHLLEAGYAVRGAARGPKVHLLQTAFDKYPKFEVVEISDIATGDFKAALKDVEAVIHVASPLFATAAPDVVVQGALDGTLNILRQAVDAGIFKVVITSSWATSFDPDMARMYSGETISEKDWGRTTVNEAVNGGHEPFWVYLASKIIAEEAAWKFAEEHPKLDLATINPPFIFGPYVGPLAPTNPSQLGTNGLFYPLMTGEAGRALPEQTPPHFVDVRDVALAHIRALELSPLSAGANVRDKRFVVAQPKTLTWKEAVEYFSKNRPDLEGRLPSTEGAPPLPGPIAASDTTRAKEVLGITEYISWEKTVNDAIDALLEVEKAWAV